MLMQNFFALGIVSAWTLGLKAKPLPVPVVELSKIAAAAALMSVALAALPPLGLALDLTVKPALGILIYGALAYGLDLGGARGLADKALAKLPLATRPIMNGPP